MFTTACEADIYSWPISQLNVLLLCGQSAKGHQGFRLNPWVDLWRTMDFPSHLGMLSLSTILPYSIVQWTLTSAPPNKLQQNGSKNQIQDTITCTWINQRYCFVLKGTQISFCSNKTLSLLNETSEQWIQHFSVSHNAWLGWEPC